MTEQQPKQKKALVKLPFPMPNESNQAGDAVHTTKYVRNLNNMQIELGCHRVVLVVLWVSANLNKKTGNMPVFLS